MGWGGMGRFGKMWGAFNNLVVLNPRGGNDGQGI